MTTTHDDFLGGRLTIEQPRSGYRAGIDPVLLAAFVQTAAGSILDVGCGVGAVSLCLSWRLPHVHITGIDCQGDLIAVAQRNAVKNKMDDRVHFMTMDLQELSLPSHSFDAVVTNPPYFDGSAPSRHPARALARSQQVPIDTWVAQSLTPLKNRGYLYMIYPVRGLMEALHALRTTGDISLYPLWTAPETPSKLILIRARKSVKSPPTLLPGLILHDNHTRLPSGRLPFSSAAEDVLRHGKGIILPQN